MAIVYSLTVHVGQVILLLMHINANTLADPDVWRQPSNQPPSSQWTSSESWPGAFADPFKKAPIYAVARPHHPNFRWWKSNEGFSLFLSVPVCPQSPLFLFPSALFSNKIQDMIPQNTAPWLVEYFQLKEFEKWHVQKELSDLFLKQAIIP